MSKIKSTNTLFIKRYLKKRLIQYEFHTIDIFHFFEFATINVYSLKYVYGTVHKNN